MLTSLRRKCEANDDDACRDAATDSAGNLQPARRELNHQSISNNDARR